MEEKDIDLQPGQELRIEVNFEQTLFITLDAGKAEIFGQELPVGTQRRFPGPDKFAIFTWHGCRIKVSGEYTALYVSTTETPMSTYLFAHGTINRIRNECVRDRRLGPRILVSGGANSGKTTLCKILLNYALKCGWRPILCELDVTNNNLFLPGCISAASYYQNRWDTALSYFFGHTNISTHSILFKSLLSEMASAVRQRQEKELQYCKENFKDSYSPSKNMYASGCIIDFPPLLDLNMSEDIMNHIIDVFQCDLVLVIDQERLLSNLRRRGMEALQLTKSGGVVPLESEYKVRLQYHFINNYFANFQMHQVTLIFSDISLYKISTSSTPVTALTFGESPTLEGLTVNKVAPTQDALMNSIVGVLNTSDIIKATISGVVHVFEVDEANQFIKVLSPGELPSRSFILGSLKKLK